MSSSATCFHKSATKQSPPLIQNGKLVIQAHHIGWIVTGAFTITATIVSLWLVNKHLRSYTNKHEQRYIVRILFMVPIYSIVSFASYLFWNHSTPLLLLRDCYESTVLASFFYLLLLYLSPSADEQRAIFLKVGLSKENDRQAIQRGKPVKKWMFPLGSVKSKPADGLYFLQMMKWGVLQYCVIRPTTTLVAIILDYVGLYCEDSWSPGWGHVYITIIVSISVSIAMYCLIQVYIPVAPQLAHHRPILKLFAVKAIVFLTFWQATFLSLLSTFGVVKDTQYMTAGDINIGIGAILETVEMTIFASLHIKAFSYKPYLQPRDSLGDDPTKSPGFNRDNMTRTPRMRSLLHAFDLRETFRELWEGSIYIVRRWRGAETDTMARRIAIREDLFAPAVRSKRISSRRITPDLGQEDKFRYHPVPVVVDMEKEVHVDHERQWLGIGDDYIYGLEFSRRERSAGLAEQIEIELERRGVPVPISHGMKADQMPKANIGVGKRRRSWWSRALERVSRTSVDDERRLSAPTQSGRQTHRGDGYNGYDSVPIVEGTHDDLPSSSNLDKSAPFSQTSSPLTPISISPRRNLPSSTHHPFSPVLGSTCEDVLARLFSNNPSSEPSGPTSQTHPSSRGNHVRLITPAAAVPVSALCASERRPTLVSPTDSVPESQGILGEFGSAQDEMTSSPVRMSKYSAATESSLNPRRSNHLRERAHHERLSSVITWSATRSAPRTHTSSSRIAPRSRSAVTESPSIRTHIELAHPGRVLRHPQIILPAPIDNAEACIGTGAASNRGFPHPYRG